MPTIKKPVAFRLSLEHHIILKVLSSEAGLTIASYLTTLVIEAIAERFGSTKTALAQLAREGHPDIVTYDPTKPEASPETVTQPAPENKTFHHGLPRNFEEASRQKPINDPSGHFADYTDPPQEPTSLGDTDPDPTKGLHAPNEDPLPPHLQPPAEAPQKSKGIPRKDLGTTKPPRKY